MNHSNLQAECENYFHHILSFLSNLGKCKTLVVTTKTAKASAFQQAPAPHANTFHAVDDVLGKEQLSKVADTVQHSRVSAFWYPTNGIIS